MREIYLSVPTLNFELMDASFRRFTAKRAMLLNSMDRFLLQRGNINPILSLRISWDFLICKMAMVCDEESRFASWIQHAVRCNVQVIELYLAQMSNARKYLLPSCIWKSTSLRSLVVVSNSLTCQVPSSFSFCCNLYSLKLRGVRIEDKKFWKWVSCSCKSIKEMLLENICGRGLKNITVESSSLQSFCLSARSVVCHLHFLCEKLEDLDVECFLNDFSGSMNVTTPNLKNFRWRVNKMNHLNVGSLMCLEKVELLLSSEIVYPDKRPDIHSGFFRTKVLVLDGMIMKDMLKEGSLPLLMDKIRKLRICSRRMDDGLIPAIIYVLRRMTNLYTLSISSDNLDSSSWWAKFLNRKSKDHVIHDTEFNVGFWKSQRLAVVSQLEEVTIELSNYGSNEIEFAKYLLEHSLHLKRLVILYLPKQSNLVKKICVVKSVSTARIVLQKKKNK